MKNLDTENNKIKMRGETPETDELIKESNGQWSFVLKETCQRLERERNEARLMSQALKFATIVLTVVVVAISSILFLVATQRDDLKKQAVERGFAEWVVDSNGRTTTWQWKEAK